VNRRTPTIDSEDERRAATGRLFDHYLHRAYAAALVGMQAAPHRANSSASFRVLVVTRWASTIARRPRQYLPRISWACLITTPCSCITFPFLSFGKDTLRPEPFTADRRSGMLARGPAGHGSGQCACQAFPLAVMEVGSMDRFRAYGPHQIDSIARRFGLPDVLEAILFHSEVLPFRVNEYLLSQLIDWGNPESDPIFHLVFPQRGMLSGADEKLLESAFGTADRQHISAAVGDIRTRLNPHPGNQRKLNVPRGDDGPIPGLQHKYKETMLYFPSHGQTCHSYCTYCFRWAQFVGDHDLRFAALGPSTRSPTCTPTRRSATSCSLEGTPW
jgi:hypothetical protein